MVCERSGVRVPPVEEACDITPSWLLAGGDPTPGFLPSDVSCDLAEGAKGQNGDAGGATRLVPWRGQTRTFGRRPRGDPGLVAVRPAASETGTVTFVASGVLARRRGQRNPGSSGGRAEQRLGFRQSPHAGPVPASVPTSSWGPPEGGAPVASSRGWGSGPRPRGQCGAARAAGCGRPLAEGGASAPTLTFVPFRFASGALAQCRLWPGHSPLPSWRLVQGQGRRGGDPSPGRPPRP